MMRTWILAIRSCADRGAAKTTSCPRPLSSRRRAALVCARVTAAVLSALSPGCERPLPAPTPPGTSQPAASQPALQTTTRPATQPAVVAPPYVDIEALEHNGRPARVTAQIEGGIRLLLQTENVRRLTIRRSVAPLARDRSTILVLDGQPLEWLASSKVETFARSANGVWTPVR